MGIVVDCDTTREPLQRVRDHVPARSGAMSQLRRSPTPTRLNPRNYCASYTFYCMHSETGKAQVDWRYDVAICCRLRPPLSARYLTNHGCSSGKRYYSLHYHMNRLLKRSYYPVTSGLFEPDSRSHFDQATLLQRPTPPDRDLHASSSLQDIPPRSRGQMAKAW